MVRITLKFDYNWIGESIDENDIRDCLMELSPDELLAGAQELRIKEIL